MSVEEAMIIMAVVEEMPTVVAEEVTVLSCKYGECKQRQWWCVNGSPCSLQEVRSETCRWKGKNKSKIENGEDKKMNAQLQKKRKMNALGRKEGKDPRKLMQNGFFIHEQLV